MTYRLRLCSNVVERRALACNRRVWRSVRDSNLQDVLRRCIPLTGFKRQLPSTLSPPDLSPKARNAVCGGNGVKPGFTGHSAGGGFF